MEVNLALVVDLMLTARCNLKCPFCYGPDPSMSGELTIEQKKFLIQELAKREVSHLVIAGGEPLLSPHATELVPWAKKLGLRVGLQTNAFFFDRLQAVIPHLEWLALPLDGCDTKIQKLLRTSNAQLAKTRAAVELLRAHGTGTTRLKIGTVVTPQNLDQLPSIAEEVARLRPDIWKWYELRPRGEGYRNFEMLHLAREQIIKAESQIRLEHPTLKIFVSFIEQSTNAYLIVNPDSEALIPQVDSYLSAGKLIRIEGGFMAFDDSVWVRFLELRDELAQRTNVVHSFPGWI